MKTLREYHIESYWAEEALRRKRMAEIKEQVKKSIPAVILIALELVITYEFFRLVFEVI